MCGDGVLDCFCACASFKGVASGTAVEETSSAGLLGVGSVLEECTSLVVVGMDAAMCAVARVSSVFCSSVGRLCAAYQG